MLRILRTRAMVRFSSVLVGCATGLTLFSISQTKGPTLYIITGGITGVAAVFAYELYGRAARLTEVKITVPQLSEFTFVVNNDARQTAWQLFVETVTRISTQPLLDGEGIMRETLSSLYGLFSTTREVLKSSRPSVPAAGGLTVENLAIAMLNKELRPFLAKWHPLLRAFEETHPQRPESEWPGSAACREELKALQARMHTYLLGFAKLAGVPDASSITEVVIRDA